MLDKILQFSVYNRGLIILVVLAVAIFGAFSLRKLPIDAVPDITNVQVQINTMTPALTPEEVEQRVTFPLETALAGIPGLQETRSLSRNGFSQITAVFEEGTDIYFARQQVAERLTAAREGLPPGADPAMGPISTGLGEIYMYLVEYRHPEGSGATTKGGEPGWQDDGSYQTPEGEKLRTETERAAYLRTVQEWIIRPQLRNVKDVAGVDSIGGYEKQYQVQPDLQKLVSFGLTFHDVIEALERSNVSTGAGYVEHKGESYAVRAVGRIEDPEEIGEIAVGSRHGTPIYIRDVAIVGAGRELRTGSASSDGHEAVVGTALMLLGANSRTVAAAVDAKMAEINRSLPPDIEAKPVLNRTKLVDATIGTVERNLSEGAILVIVVLMLLLGNLRAALITALAIPLSMLITAIGMVESRTSANLMSLGAVDFGLIVDGAVIIVENTLRRLADKQHESGRTLTGKERVETVISAAREMIQPSVYGQAIIITVYLPLLFLTGVEGKMFRPMALTVIFALVAAFVLSLTVIPALLALVIRGRVTEKENFFIRGVKGVYAPMLKGAVRLRWVTVPAAVAAFGLSLLVFTRLGSEFIPTLDEKDIALQAVRIASTSLTQSTQMQLELERTLKKKFPQIAFVFSKTGTAELAADPMPPSASDTFVMLKPVSEWPDPHLSKAELIEQMEAALGELPGNNYEFTQPIQMRFNELLAGTRGDVAIKVFGDRFEVMTPTAERIAEVLRGIPGSADVNVEQVAGLPSLTLEIDRKAAARYGVSVADVQDVFATAVGGQSAGTVFQGDRRFDLVVRLSDEARGNLEGISELPIPLTRDGDRVAYVPLSSLATMRMGEGPNQISRENGKRRMVVTANVRDRDMGSFVKEAQAAIDKVMLPPGYYVTWGGQFKNLQAARERLMIVVPACFALIFLLLFGSFRSVKHALMVFTCVPLALSGGIVALWLRGMPFSISAAVGFIALSGVAVLNGLVMLTFINQLRREGVGLEEALIRGSMTRLRPVLMTALVASLGFIPMALARGSGAEVQKPLATVVIGGLASATVLTLFVLPALYRLTHRLGN